MSRGPNRRRISEATKAKWFHRGALALETMLPDRRGAGYCCPLCIRASTSIAAFTVEDVPPRHIDGRPLVLTCEPCNSRSGAELDFHWANAEDVLALMRGELSEPLTADLVCGTARITVAVTNSEDIMTSRVIRKASSQAAIDEQKRLLSNVSATGLEAKMTFRRSRYSEKRAMLSVLRAGYLAAFSLSGYRYIPHWRRIREQIAEPGSIDSALLQLVKYNPALPKSRRHFAVFAEPAELRCIVVGFGRWTALLPLSHDSLLYQPPPDGGWNWKEDGVREYEWPTAPTFGVPDRTAEPSAV